MLVADPDETTPARSTIGEKELRELGMEEGGGGEIDFQREEFLLSRSSRLTRIYVSASAGKDIQVAAICQLAYLVLKITLDADTGSPASVALRVVDADRIRLLLHHVVVVVDAVVAAAAAVIVVVLAPWTPSPQIFPWIHK